MTELINILRAKSKSEDPENFLFIDHVKEILKRVEQLYNFVIKNKEAIDYHPIRNERFFEYLAVASIIHDFGKINYEFQKKLFRREERHNSDWKYLDSFFKHFKKSNVNYPRHEIISALWSAFLLGNEKWDKEVRTALLLHHYNEYFIGEKNLMEIIYDYYDGVVTYLEFIKEKPKELKSFIDSLLSAIEDEFSDFKIASSALQILRNNTTLEKANELLEGIKSHEDDLSGFAEFYEIENSKSDYYDFLVFLGCLRRCDYSSRGGVEIESDNVPEVYEGLSEKIERKIKEISKSPYIWQKDIIRKVKTKKSTVLVAPTGSGKTEFALLLAEQNKAKLIYTVPLRVALNDLFMRFGGFDGIYFEKEFVDILHSTSFIEYLKEERESKDLDIDKKLTSAKLLSSPILLTTPDQVFLTSLNYYGSDKVMSVYPLSLIVIDEIQTYNEEMAAIIIKTLQIVNDVNGHVLVITATFPPYFEKFLSKIFKDELEIIDLAEFNEDIKNRIKNFNLGRHKIKLVEKSLFKYGDEGLKENEEGVEDLKKWIEIFKDKNLFIIVNNVRKAIEIYKMSENKENTYLLHSRLLEIEKSKRIKEIKEKIKNGEKVIAIATQIVEASVDIDFDVMITEISTIDSQIQRWGRVYRNRDKDYSENIPNIVVFTGGVDNGSLKLDMGTTAVYDRKVVEKTYKILKKYEDSQKPLDYEKERGMIEEVFKEKIEGKPLKEIYIEEIEKTLDYLKYFTAEKKSQAQRIFRTTAGINAIIPGLIVNNGIDKKEVRKVFAKIIVAYEKRSWTWEKIIDEIQKLTGRNVSMWELKKILYEHSVSIPVFYLDRSDFRRRIPHEFKGFYVLNLSEKEAETIRKYGIDEIFKKLENVEINELISNII